MTLEDSESKDCDFRVSSGAAIGDQGTQNTLDIEHDNKAVGRGQSYTNCGVNTPTAGTGRAWRTPISEMEAIKSS